MKVIMPLAGKGTRLRPHTHSKPKPLMKVAGKAVLGHILAKLQQLPVDEIIFITGDMGDKIQEYVERNFSFKTRYIRQEKQLGDGHAISLAAPYVDGDVLIIFVDTIFETDLGKIKDAQADGIVWVKETKTPEHFGIVMLDDRNRIARLVEKPKAYVGSLAAVGLYYFKDSRQLFQHLQGIMDERRTSQGNEFRLADAIARMVEHGAVFVPMEVDVWADCGKPETLLETNRYLLEHGHHREIATKNSVIIPPVFIEDGAKIQNSIIGPYVSIAKNCKIDNAIIRSSIIDENATIANATLADSLVGDGAIVRDTFRKLNVGDNSEIDSG